MVEVGQQQWCSFQEGFLADTLWMGEWQLSCGSGHKQLRRWHYWH